MKRLLGLVAVAVLAILPAATATVTALHSVGHPLASI